MSKYAKRRLVFPFMALMLGQAAATPLKVAVVGPLSGDQSAFGKAMQQGAELAVSFKRKAFAAMGYDLVLVPFDDQASATRASGIADKITADPAILGVIGAYNSSVSNVLAGAFEPSGLAIISPGSTNDKLTQNGWKHFSRVVAPDGAQGTAAADLLREKQVKRVAVISDNTTYGNGLMKITETALKDSSIAVPVALGAGTPEQINSAVKAIKKANVDAVYFGGTYDVGAVLLKSLRAAGVKGFFLGADGLDTADYLKAARHDAVRTSYTTVFGLQEDERSSQSFVKLYQTAYKTKPDGLAAFSFDAMNVLLNALEQSMAEQKWPSRAQVAAAVRQIDLPACKPSEFGCQNITGPISFNTYGERTRARIFIMEVSPQLRPSILKALTIRQ